MPQVAPHAVEQGPPAVDEQGLVALLAEERREGQRLRTELFAWMKGSDWIIRRPEQIEARSQEALKALKALGYVE